MRSTTADIGVLLWGNQKMESGAGGVPTSFVERDRATAGEVGTGPDKRTVLPGTQHHRLSALRAIWGKMRWLGNLSPPAQSGFVRQEHTEFGHVISPLHRDMQDRNVGSGKHLVHKLAALDKTTMV